MDISLIKLEALYQAYTDACERQDFRTCDLIHQEIQRLITNKPLLIPCGTELKLDPNDILLT